MNSSVLLTFSIVIGLVYTVIALKNDECEGKLIFDLSFSLIIYLSKSDIVLVCINTVEKFVNTLSEDVKKDTKKIETAFKDFCKGTKSKENRFVSIYNNEHL